jgi:hypothetical protein
MWEFVKNNPGLCLMGVYVLAEVVVALSPTKKDDAVFDIIRAILNKYIPRFKKGGGTFNSK